MSHRPVLRWLRQASAWLALGCALLLYGCASLPDQVARRYSEAQRDVADSTLARVATATLAQTQRQDLSGLRLLPDGAEAFEARLALVDSSEKSIDAQYYVVADDRSGRQFVQALAGAAARGVRVRLLVDDLNAGATKGLLAELASRANVELRVFNPLPVRTGSLHARVLLSLHMLDEVNRRMHNKLLVADNSFAIAGGRNIADEYFRRSTPAHFIDLDVLVAGPAVPELSRTFDDYWNSALAYPLQSLIDLQAAAADRATVAAHPPLPAPRPDDNLLAQIARQDVALQPAHVRVVADSVAGPEAPATDPEPREGAVMHANLALLRSARQEALIVSPYLVPMPRMLDALDVASAGGAHISMVTNSLATTDEPLAHFGYARYRQRLVRMGIALHELMPAGDARDSGRDDIRRGSLARLHAKLAVVDRRFLYVGSMNMDRRSAHANTELGLIVDSTALADELVDLSRREHIASSYSVRRGPQGGAIEWAIPGPAQDLRMTRDPMTGWTHRLAWSLLASLIDEDYL